MPLQVGDKVPSVTLYEMGADGPAAVSTDEYFAGRKVVLFAVPGAFTPTCSAAHLPSFIRVADQMRAKGIDEIACLSVNDWHVMRLWGEQSGATVAGILMLADPASEFTRAIGMAFSNPQVGFYDRCIRFSALVEDGEVKIVNLEAGPGVCELTAGETLLGQL